MLRDCATLQREKGPRKMTLPPRRQQVFELMCQGYPHKMIAQLLGIANATEQRHYEGLMRDLRAHSVVGLIRNGMKAGLPVVEWLRR